MRVQRVKDVVVRAMVEFPDCGFLTMLRRQVLSIFFVTFFQNVVRDGIDFNNAWLAVMERGRSHKFGGDLVPLGAGKFHWSAKPSCTFGWPFLVPTIARVGKTKVLPAAISCYELRAFLFGGAIPIFDTNCAFFTAFDERQCVETVHEILRDGDFQNCRCFFEMAFHNLNLHVLDVRCCMPR